VVDQAVTIEHGVDGARGRDLHRVRQAAQQTLTDLAGAPVRITKRILSSITELSFHGMPLPPPRGAKSVTHVSGTFCYLCVRPVTQTSAQQHAACGIISVPMEEAQVPLQVSVLIVSYNTAAALRRCLEALEQSTARETFEVVVVDNGSLDDSTEVIDSFPNVTPLRLPRNFGFVKALNIGMRTGKAEFFLLLDPRTEVMPDTVSALAARLAQTPEAVAVCPSLATPDGQDASRLFRLPTRNRLGAIAAAGRFEPAQAPEDTDGAAAVEFATFSALMVRSYFMKGLRYIDEHYAQSWADAEIAAQIRRAGKKTLLLPGVRAIWHAEDDIRLSMPPSAQALLAADWGLAAATYAGKHFGFLAKLRIRVGAALSALFSFQIRRFSFLVSGQKIDGTQTVL
jgi:GT2 family glycosyltransferase